MPSRPDRGSIRQRPSVWVCAGTLRKRSEQGLELGKLHRLLAPADRGDEARERAECDLLRRLEQCSLVDRGIARLARLAVACEEVVSGVVERFAGTPQATRRERQRLRRQTERLKRACTSPHAYALEARIGIARIGDETDAPRLTAWR